MVWSILANVQPNSGHAAHLFLSPSLSPLLSHSLSLLLLLLLLFFFSLSLFLSLALSNPLFLSLSLSLSRTIPLPLSSSLSLSLSLSPTLHPSLSLSPPVPEMSRTAAQVFCFTVLLRGRVTYVHMQCTYVSTREKSDHIHLDRYAHYAYTALCVYVSSSQCNWAFGVYLIKVHFEYQPAQFL